ncbi:hypothetical protein SAMN04487866_1424 [Thermoactinomyces sp. DSM 45891]|uniref:hypothetical protein n=1 Tax=Thermoactinomyces sp. DSM 45891 TaxID=1761907 RepID=UPI0009239F90|nr:hypothetical protein [Thermoactinomyces sp. DSM 45891]SFX84436.1 hypothetical protein SAMN04487866_1424 [Thermoactinomyces sp. DSM 45891]
MTLGIFNPEDPYEEKGIAYHLGAIAGDVLTMMVGAVTTVGSVSVAVIGAGRLLLHASWCICNL